MAGCCDIQKACDPQVVLRGSSIDTNGLLAIAAIAAVSVHISIATAPVSGNYYYIDFDHPPSGGEHASQIHDGL